MLRVLFAAAGLASAVVFAQEAPPELRFTVTDFAVEGENPLSEVETRALLAPYQGEHVGLGGLQSAADALEQAVRAKGFAFHRVTLPPQATRGVITLKVVKFSLADVAVKGNRHFSKENVLRSLPQLKAGQTPNNRELARDLALAQEHPAKQLTVAMKESEQPDSINAEVEAKDNRPLAVFASLSNTGNETTGKGRLSLGVQYSNLFDRDHTATLSYTTSPGHWGDVKQKGVYYRAPLYGLGGSLSAFYSESSVNSGTVGDFFTVSGRGRFWGVHYNQMLLPLGDYSHRLNFGYENRFFDNNVTFVGQQIGTDVRSSPLIARYDGKFEKPWGVAGFNAEYARNLGGGDENTDAAYAAARAGAARRWEAVRYGFDVLYQLPKAWLLSVRLRGQFADEPLIAGEMFGLGGAGSVRGFEEREVTGDSGQQINLEVWTPPIQGNLRLLGFLDMGQATLENLQTGQQQSCVNIASLGAGLRWRWKEALNVSLDGAYVLNGADTTERTDSKLHFSLFYRF